MEQTNKQTLANPEVTINSQKTRDEINKAIGVTAVAAVARTRNNNIVITTTTKYNANILLVPRFHQHCPRGGYGSGPS